MERSTTGDAAEPLLKALLYGGPLLYFVVTAGVGLVFLDDTVSMIALAMAVVGGVLVYVVLKKTFESQYDVTL